MEKAKENNLKKIIKKEKFPLVATMAGTVMGAGIGTLAVRLLGGSYELSLIGLVVVGGLGAIVSLRTSWLLQEKVEEEE